MLKSPIIAAWLKDLNMPTVRINGVRLHCEESGHGRETVVFAHGLLWSARQFADQIGALSHHWRCLAYDHRGQGRSEVPRDRIIRIDQLVEDAAALIKAQVKGPCHFVGASTGAQVGLRLAARYPRLLRSLVVIGAQAGPEPPENRARYRALAAAIRMGGQGVSADPLMGLMFARPFLTEDRATERRQQAREALRNNKRRVYRAIRGEMERPGLGDALTQINTPTLVLRGEHDALVSQRASQKLCDRLPTAMYVPIPRAGHNCPVEQPEAVTTALETFLEAFQVHTQFA